MAIAAVSLWTQISDKRKRLFLLQILIIDGGLLVLRNKLEDILMTKNITLEKCLAKEKSTLASLKSYGIITQCQFDILFPKGNVPPTTRNMDITLIIFLLRNLKSIGLNDSFDWNSTPNATDETLEADICRLETHRKYIGQILSTGEQLIDSETLRDEVEKIGQMLSTDEQPIDSETLRDEVEKILVRQSPPEINIQYAINELKESHFILDDDRTLEIEAKWRKYYNDQVDEMSEEIEQLKEVISKMKNDMDTVFSKFNATDDSFNSLANELPEKGDSVSNPSSLDTSVNTESQSNTGKKITHTGNQTANDSTVGQTMGRDYEPQATGTHIDVKQTASNGITGQNTVTNNTSNTGEQVQVPGTDNTGENKGTSNPVVQEPSTETNISNTGPGTVGNNTNTSHISGTGTGTNQSVGQSTKQGGNGKQAQGRSNIVGQNPLASNTCEIGTVSSEEQQGGSDNTGLQSKSDGLQSESQTGQAVTKTTSGWKTCVELSDVRAAEQLLNNNVIPDQESLNLACRNFGRKHKVVKDMCTKVCTYIQKLQPDVIKFVWPSYRYVKDAPVEQYSENDVIFVVVTQSGKEVNIENVKFKTYIRESSEISQESKAINKLEAERKHYDDKGIRRKQKKIVKCMDENVDNLLEKHSKITTISASLFKSKNFKPGKPTYDKNLCIVLYVHVKGYIPLHEDPFDQKIGEYDVDVRECVFTPLMNGPKDFHSILKMGLEIGIISNPNDPGKDSKIGTIGHFEPKYFVTCAHVVMSIEDMCKLSDSQKSGKQTDINIYQPLEQKSRKICGHVIRAVYYQKTGKNNVGVEAALVEIKDREFTGYEFPHSELLVKLGLTGNLSQILQPGIYRPNHDKHIEVIKYGCESNVTKGRYTLVSNPVVTLEALGIRLRNQITIVPTEEFSHFAVEGDSGSVVFELIEGKLYPTCMIEGTMGDGRIVATPLIDVLVALDIKSPEDMIKLYEDEDDESDMDDSQ